MRLGARVLRDSVRDPPFGCPSLGLVPLPFSQEASGLGKPTDASKRMNRQDTSDAREPE
jgi:hypothetical protein